ncbi:hypothetical protein [Actinomadura hibisca]|uniref:hypothetical protein n=1 Tax=Actinomadura hibisca TaxID=68565 RepID=UPI0014723C6E|nr:hypothetical protein [Actinomadura hibisca]
MSYPSLRTSLIFCVIAALTLTGCSEDQKKSTPTSSTPKPGATTAPPSYTVAKIKSALLAPKEMGKDVSEIDVALTSLKERKAPMCSLSSAKLSGSPDVAVRQFKNSERGGDEIKYGQLFARYESPADASTAYTALKATAQKCPAKKHVPQKKIRKNFVLLSHDDTWQVSDEKLGEWEHFRGLEKHTEPSSQTKFNVYHFMYDYALSGNLVVSTLYWERTAPGKSADPIAQRATKLLKKQLQKLG